MKVEQTAYKRARPAANRRGGAVATVSTAHQTHPGGGVILSNARPPELATLTPHPPQQQQQPQHVTLPTQPYPLHHQQQMLINNPQHKLIRRGHQIELLQQAKMLCDRQDFVDLTIYCEDGVVRAHQMLLAVASPFLKLLFQTSPLYGTEDICLILPETKACLVQALIHFVYTGTVVSKEDHFYSLMKLVYALSINASIEAESTNERPTAFSAPLVPPQNLERVKKLPYQTVQPTLPTVPVQMSHLNLQHHQPNVSAVAASAIAAIQTPALPPSCVLPQGKITTRYTTGPPANSQPIPQHVLNVTTSQAQAKQLPIQLPTQPVPMVNGVTIKNEPQHITGSSYIAIDPNTGLHYKVEVPNGQLTGDLGSDPLAAIMHETIFTETSAGQTTMYTTENGQVIYTTQPASTVSVPTLMAAQTVTHNQIDPSDLSTSMAGSADPAGGNGEDAAAKRGKKRKQNNKENSVMADSVDDLPCAPDDEDLNTPYACAHCNKTIKGRVMLQAHQYQEHYDNPDLARLDIGDKHACRVCLKLFTRNSDVKAHILRVHCGDRRYPCTMCGKRFKESTHLRKHLYTHTGERPHFCTLCEKGFQTSSDLKRHKRTRVHQERVEQVKAEGGTPPEGEATADTSNTEFQRWVEDDDGRNQAKQVKTSNVNNTAQQLITSITQPVNMISANGQSIESTIDLKALTAASTSTSNTSLAGAPMAVPVTTSWGPDGPVVSTAPGSTHYDLKDLSSSAPNDVDMLIHSTPVTTSVAASMPSIQHHELQLHQRQQTHLLQAQPQDHHQQLFAIHESLGQMTTTRLDQTLSGQTLVMHKKDSPSGGQDEEERLTVVEDDESSSANAVA